MWYVNNPNLYEELKSLIRSHSRLLHVVLENGKVYIRGNFPVVAEGKAIDEYQLEILLPDDYPKTVPLVWETEGRIPRTADRHVNTINQSLCLFLIDERWKHYPPGANIIDFLDGPVRSFLLNQQYYDLTSKWLNGERGHGVNGVYEYYSEELGSTNPTVITIFLEYLSKDKSQRPWICYCGSGDKLRRCHKPKLDDMRTKISPEVAANSLRQVLLAINEVKNSIRT